MSLKRAHTHGSFTTEDENISKRHRTTSPSPSDLIKPIPVRFLIMSDTHDRHDEILQSTPQCDVLLHCGDFTEDGSPEAIKQALDAFSKIEAELKLFIAGNHEISLDRDYYLSQGGTEEVHLKARALTAPPGIRFLEEGTHEFTLKSGAYFKIFVSPWTPQYGSSAFQYPTSRDRFNGPEITPPWAQNVGTESSIIPEGVDIVMTHGPPQYILDRTDGSSAGCEHLRRAIARVRPRLHCFGHVHTGYGAQKVWYDDRKGSGEGDGMVLPPQEWVGKNQAKRKGYACLGPGVAEAFRKNRNGKGKGTLMINAAIVDGNNKPENMPWLVELDLS
ncbi:Metallo-dependent phosphatase [Karstenula rhodostoma CBS 690.94]|uniref:Metallo-dependent phosphatase n=1 Tax=Karstenula rhodostoma CBS 690.94 TaxID=1392251 RepID=A0A9P4PB69_9PLEO|nr:Metallo-dependent phosphatase [Karstenula rhodostoma CBS 690.94]